MELVFVYNAKTDPISAISDYAHKVFSPSTYECELCALTHHNLGQRSAWKEFKKEWEVEMSFWYIRQFEKEFGIQPQYPIVYERSNSELKTVLAKEDLQQIKDVHELIDELSSYIRANQ